MKKVLLFLVLLLVLTGCDIESSKSEGKGGEVDNTTEPTVYTITFNSNGGEGSMVTLSKEEGEILNLPVNTFTKENHEFTGWCTSSDGLGVSLVNGSNFKVGSESITLYAQWRDIRFISKWEIKYINNTSTTVLKFPLSKNGDYDFQIDWGDGSTERITEVLTNNYIEHTYPDYGDYIVTITGKCIGFGYDNNRNHISATSFWIYELKDIMNWGDVQFHDEGWVFYGTRGITNFSAKDVPDLSNLTSLKAMFKSSTFNGDISNWKTSNITNMEDLFNNSQFTGNISDWNTSLVTNMDFMFFASPFNGDISGWNVSKVTSMFRMFSSSSFNGDISAWNTSQVKNMFQMFWCASEFNCGGIDISTWNWRVGNVTSNRDMFVGSKLHNAEPGWYVPI